MKYKGTLVCNFFYVFQNNSIFINFNQCQSKNQGSQMANQLKVRIHYRNSLLLCNFSASLPSGGLVENAIKGIKCTFEFVNE